MADMKARVLVVDDEPNIREVVERYLRREGFDTVGAADGEEAVLRSADADLVVLDLMLPKLSGIEACRQIRSARDIPIIMLTAKSEETDVLVGLGIGADDYITKPFSPRELVARVQAVLRRAQKGPPEPGDVVHVGSLRINPSLRTVERDGEQLELTAREFELLHFLATHPGQVFTREQLLDHVWDYDFPGDTSTVTVHVRRLREKVEPDPVRPRYIKTVWGVGYKVEPK
ncbi:MAG: winged helix-turn-helix domain-containing protein [Chloroflexota bacterium]|nr:MAG: DNA-binding response regulator [Chloroflexota bacterium]